jgi:hypothetical protein
LKANLINSKVNPEGSSDTPILRRSLSVKLNFLDENDDDKIQEEHEEKEDERKTTETKLQKNILQNEALTQMQMINFMVK